MTRAAARKPVGNRNPGLPGRASQAFTVVGGMAAWGLAVLIAYPTVQVACEVGLPVLVRLVRWVATAVALAATLTGYRVYRRARRLPVDDGDPTGRTRVERMQVVGLGGMLLSAFAVLLLVIENMATWVIDPCL